MQLQRVIVTGYITDNRESSGKLHFIEPQIQTQQFCNESFSNSYITHAGDKQAIGEALPNLFQSNIMCAAVETGRDASCRGDSGAPLFRYEFFNESLTERRYIQLGVLHGSVNSCDNRYPGIYSRLEHPSVFKFIKSFGNIDGKVIYTASSVGM